MALRYILYIILMFFMEDMTIISAATNVRIVLVAEKLQPEVYEWFSDSIEYMSSISPEELLLESGTIFLDRDNEEDSFKMFCTEVSKGVTILLDMTWSPWLKIIDLMDNYGIPVVAADLGEGMPTLEALLQLLELKNATDAVLIFQKENVMEHVLYKILGSSVLRILALHDFGSRMEQLRNLRPTPGQFVIFGSTEYLQDSYKMAVQTKLLTLPDRWILASTDLMTSRLDVSVLESKASLVGLVTGTACLLLNMPDSCSDQVDTVLMNSLLMGKILKQLLDTVMASEFQQLIMPECDISPPEIKMENRTHIREFFTNLQMKVSKEEPLLYWDERRRGLYFRAEQVVQVGGGDGLRTAARWYTDESIKTVPKVNITSPRRFLRVGTTTAIPWTYPKLDSEGNPILNDNGEPMYEGYCIDLIAKLAEVMDFDYEIVVPKEGRFGVKMQNGTWNGLIGDLAKGDTDIAVAATIMTSQREEVVDFVAPYFDQTGLSIVIRKPIRKTSLFKFMTVLRVEVWLSIVGALTLTAILLTVLDKYSPYSARNNKDAYPYPCREFTLKESLWFALTSFTPQGGGEAPKALSSRALVAAYWLFVVLMLATFTANLAAFLTVERMQTPVSSLEQLARQSRINYTVVEGGVAHRYFINMKNAEDTLYRVWKEITLNASSDELQYQVWDYPVREQYGHILLAINSSMPLKSADEGFQKVDESIEADFAFIHDSSEIKYRVMRNCNLTIVGEVFGERPYAVAVQQGSRIQEELSRAILQLQKDRYLDSLTAKYWNTSCVDNDDSEGITLDSLGGVFIATLFGLVLALVTLVWEIFYYKRKEKVQATTKISDIKTNKFVENWVTRGKEKKKSKEAIRRITIGDTFKAVKDKRKPKISFINVEPKLEWNP